MEKEPRHSEHKLWQKLLAELIGTFFLTYSSASTAILKTSNLTESTSLGHALSPALVVVALVYAIGNVSGAHFNPIVTIAFCCRRVFALSLVLPYILMQLIGATLASLAVQTIFGNLQDGLTVPHSTVNAAFTLEILLSALLIMVILGTATRHRVIGANAAVPVGCTIFVCGLIGDSISGASMNPARSLGPAIVSGHVEHIGIYILAPLLGSFVASALTWALHRHQHKDESKVAEGD